MNYKLQKDQFQIEKSEEICEIDIGRKLGRNIEAIFTRNGEIFQFPQASVEDSGIQRYSRFSFHILHSGEKEIQYSF